MLLNSLIRFIIEYIFIRCTFYIIDVVTFFIKLLKLKKVSLVRILRINSFMDGGSMLYSFHSSIVNHTHLSLNICRLESMLISKTHFPNDGQNSQTHFPNDGQKGREEEPVWLPTDVRHATHVAATKSSAVVWLLPT